MSENIAVGYEAGGKVLEALGLKGERVRKITLTFESNSFVVEVVEKWPLEGQIDNLIEVIKEFDLVPRETKDAPPEG